VASGVATSALGGGGKNFGWYNVWLSEWCNLTPATWCHAVNTAIIQPCYLVTSFIRGQKGRSRVLTGGVVAPWPPLRTASATKERKHSLTSPESLTCHFDWDSDHPPLTNWLFHLTTSLLLVLAGGPFQFPPPISAHLTLAVSRQRLKTFLFRRSYPDLIIWRSEFTFCRGPIAVTMATLNMSMMIMMMMNDDLEHQCSSF